MTEELLQFLRKFPSHTLAQVLHILRGRNSVLVDELEMFLSCYPSGLRENALFFLPEYEVSDELARMLRFNPNTPLVELGMGFRCREAHALAAELSNLIEMFPGLGTTDALLPSHVQFF